MNGLMGRPEDVHDACVRAADLANRLPELEGPCCLMLEDGTELYTSPLLEPGQAVQLIPLNQTLKKGEYAAQVVYRCVTLDEDHAPLNAGVSGFTLYVD